MRILYVVSRAVEINTSASIRNSATIYGLLQNGHEVTLVSMEPDSSHPAYDKSIEIQGIKKLYFKTDLAHNAIKIGRHFSTVKKMIPYVYKMLYGNQIYDNLKGIVAHTDEVNVAEFDLVISSSDPKSSHLFVDSLFQKQGKNIPWIQIWGDPFADDITRTQKQRGKIEEEEQRLLNLADRIIYVSDMTCKSQQKKYSAFKDKMIYVPIPYIEPRVSGREFPDDYRDMKICYCGDYGSYIRNIIPLYKAAKELNLNLEICGMSDLELQTTGNISILPRQGAGIVRQKEDNADVLVHLSNLKGTQIPGKIYQFMSTDKVILFIMDGEAERLREIFEPFNRFIFVQNEKDRIIKTLRNLPELRKSVINAPVDYFNAKNIASIILNSLA